MENSLTEREMKVLFYLTKGLTNEQIAKNLSISVHTVKAHLEAIYEKLNVSNRVQAAMRAVVMGFVDINALL